MLGAVVGVALAGAPSSEAEVDAQLAQLLADDPQARIAAANVLASTPPELVRHLELSGIDTECARRVADRQLDDAPERCLRWNHAVYHYVRVVSALAARSVDPSDPMGAWCLPRTQVGSAAQSDEPACPLGSALRWFVRDGFDEPELIEASSTFAGARIELPEAVREAPLKEAALQGWRRMLAPPVRGPDALARHVAYRADNEAGQRFTVLPLCGGRAGFRETCAFHLFVEDGARFEQLSMLPTTDGAEVPGMPYENLRMVQGVHVHLTPDGRYGMFATDKGCCDDHTRRIDVYDLSGVPAHHCHVDVELPPGDAEAPAVRWPTVTPAGCEHG